MIYKGNYMIKDIYVFGSSNSTPGYCVSEKDSFWFLAAKDVGAKNIYQYSYPGCAFEAIEHMLTCLLLEKANSNYNFSESLFLICIPPLTRIMYYDEEANNCELDNPKLSKFIKEYHVKDNGKLHNKNNEILSHKGLSSGSLSDNTVTNSSDLRLDTYNHNYMQIQALRNIQMLSIMLQYYEANYIFINTSKPIARLEEGEGWPPKKSLSDELYYDKHCILFKNTYQSINLEINKPVDFEIYGWDGHHGPDGNKYFYEQSLKKILYKCEYIKEKEWL